MLDNIGADKIAFDKLFVLKQYKNIKDITRVELSLIYLKYIFYHSKRFTHKVV